MPCSFSSAGRPDADSSVVSAIGSMTFPLVVKPNDGAGSQSTWLIADQAEFDRLRPTLEADPLLATAIWQPYIKGRAVSIGVLISPDGDHIEVFPPAEQTLSDDGRFHYLGGVIPARDVDRTAVQNAARAACRAIDGLRGYVGVDLVIPSAAPTRPLVVEINPRLTTSYVGYRRMTDANLAERMLSPVDPAPIVWRAGPVAFNVHGKDVNDSIATAENKP
jgi:predicted ATP-grasp superfamily ATP-dependent carboligase